MAKKRKKIKKVPFDWALVVIVAIFSLVIVLIGVCAVFVGK
jgi:hypothetical protein